jgi:serine protease AprX
MARRAFLLLALLAAFASPAFAFAHGGDQKLDAVLRARAHAPRGAAASRVIIQTTGGVPADSLIKALHGKAGRRLTAVHGQVAEIPDVELDALASSPLVRAVSLDRRVIGTMERTGATIGATWARQNLGVDGTGVNVAIIDSGVASWHDDLDPQHIVQFVDFVDFQTSAYDDYGHGTHVAGIIAGNGYDSGGARSGIAPGARLVVLKVLDADGTGYISNVIAAFDYAVQHKAELNIRVINLSVAAGVYESYTTDPLTLAARRAVDAGLVVVTAAGNFGKNASGGAQYGGVTAPGNAPWVLTVGATSHNGTITRADDSMAAFSSRGPTYIDYAAKPDIVAPGVGIESLTDQGTLLFKTHPSARLWGAVDTAAQPYLSLSGTSMAAPVVAGTVALMLQANPSLTPNLVKAILQYTAEHRAKIDDLTQGGGFLNARGAVQLASALANPGTPQGAPDPTPWNRHINWGNHRLGGGLLQSDANAWRTDVTWGAATTGSGDHIQWGTVCTTADCGGAVAASDESDHIVWGTSCAADATSECDTIAWGTSDEPDNIVWGTSCDGADCTDVVWGTACDTDECDNLVRGTSDESEGIVWGASCETLTPSCADVVWRRESEPPASSLSRTLLRVSRP